MTPNKYPHPARLGKARRAEPRHSSRARSRPLFTLMQILNRMILIGFGIVLLQWWLRNREEMETKKIGTSSREQDIPLDRFSPEEPQVRARPAAEDLQTPAYPGNDLAGFQAASPSPESEPFAASQHPDDLTQLEGIGPKISALLQGAGIHTYRQLAETPASRLEEILRDAGLRLADPGTWPEQARLLAGGQTQEFKDLIGQLKGGRRAN